MEPLYTNYSQIPTYTNGTPTAQITDKTPVQVNYVPAGSTVYPRQTVSATTIASKALNAGFLGFVVVSTGAMGANLNKVSAGEMTIGQAVGDSVAKGASGAAATASATAAATTLTTGGLTGLAVTIATATGVSYLINRVKS